MIRIDKSQADVLLIQVPGEVEPVHLFKTGVVVIMHWRINNYIRTDRYTPTKCIDEKAQLFEDDNGAYSLTGGIPLGIPDGLPTGSGVYEFDVAAGTTAVTVTNTNVAP